MYDRLGGERWQMKKKKQAKAEAPPPPPPAPIKRQGYSIVVMPEAEKALDELPRNIQTAMQDKIEQLRGYPEVSGIKRMWGDAYGKQRMKFWDWRMEFSVDEKNKTVTISKVGHRDTLYDEYHP